MSKHKVLIITRYYPPVNTISALRIGSFGKYLPKFGWEPVILTRESNTLNSGIEEPEGICVIRTPVLKDFKFLRGIDSGLLGNGNKRSGWARSWLRKELTFWAREFLAYPDEFSEWEPVGVLAGLNVVKKMGIDVIYSSCLPPTCHLIAAKIQQETKIPWVAEYRDLWTQNHYERHTSVRRWFERRLEKKVIRYAERLVTVSKPLSEKLQELHHKPVDIVKNGFDEEEYSGKQELTSYFSLTYTGKIYEGKRDPSLLFSVVSKLLKAGEIDPIRFKIRFYGPLADIPLLNDMARANGVEEVVLCGGNVSHKETVLRQQESSVLLLLNWDHPEEKGVYTGKLFEYLGARRPILAIPRIPGSVVDAMISETNCGFSVRTDADITRILLACYKGFIKTGKVECMGNEDLIREYTREAQAKKMADVLDRAVKIQ